MRKEAEANKEEDDKKRELADAKNDAEQTIFMTEKAIKDLGDKVDSKDKEEAEKLVEETKKALETDEVDKIKESRDKLLAKANELATKVYEEAAKANGGQAPNMEDMMKNAQAGEESKNDDNTVDAEFEEK